MQGIVTQLEETCKTLEVGATSLTAAILVCSHIFKAAGDNRPLPDWLHPNASPHPFTETSPVALYSTSCVATTRGGEVVVVVGWHCAQHPAADVGPVVEEQQ